MDQIKHDFHNGGKLELLLDASINFGYYVQCVCA